MRTLRDEALHYLSLGYVPLFVPLGTKAAQMKGWQNVQPTEESLERQFERPSNLGIRMGDVHPDGSCLVGIDIDIEEGELVRCVEHDPVEQNYIQTLAGYFLTGETRHACLPLWIGPGGDGKSVIANTFRHILGDYAKTSTDTAFVDTRQSQHSQELAWLNGARMVLVNEVNGSNPWNDSRIKAVTGGEHRER